MEAQPCTGQKRAHRGWSLLKADPSDTHEQLLQKHSLVSRFVKGQELRIQVASDGTQATLQPKHPGHPSVSHPGSTVPSPAPADQPSAHQAVNDDVQTQPDQPATVLPDSNTAPPHKHPASTSQASLPQPSLKQAPLPAHPTITHRPSQQQAPQPSSAIHTADSGPPSSANLSPSQHRHNSSAHITLLKGSDEVEVIPATPCTEPTHSTPICLPPPASNFCVVTNTSPPGMPLGTVPIQPASPPVAANQDPEHTSKVSKVAHEHLVDAHVVSVASTPMADRAHNHNPGTRTAGAGITASSLPISWAGTAVNAAVDFIPETDIQAFGSGPLGQLPPARSSGHGSYGQAGGACSGNKHLPHAPESTGGFSAPISPVTGISNRPADLLILHPPRSPDGSTDQPPLPPVEELLRTASLQGPPSASVVADDSRSDQLCRDAGPCSHHQISGGASTYPHSLGRHRHRGCASGSRRSHAAQEQLRDVRRAVPLGLVRGSAGLQGGGGQQPAECGSDSQPGSLPGTTFMSAQPQDDITRDRHSHSQHSLGHSPVQEQVPIPGAASALVEQHKVHSQQLPNGHADQQQSPTSLPASSPPPPPSSSPSLNDVPHCHVVGAAAVAQQQGEAMMGVPPQGNAIADVSSVQVGAEPQCELEGVVLQPVGLDVTREATREATCEGDGGGGPLQAHVMLLPATTTCPASGKQRGDLVVPTGDDGVVGAPGDDAASVQGFGCDGNAVAQAQQQQGEPQQPLLLTQPFSPLPDPFPEQFPGPFATSQAEDSPFPEVMLAQQQPAAAPQGCDVCVCEVQLPGHAWHIAASTCSCMLAVLMARGDTGGKGTSGGGGGGGSSKAGSTDGRWRQKRNRSSTGTQQNQHKTVMEAVVFGCEVNEGLLGLDWAVEQGAPLPTTPARLHLVTPQPLHVSVNVECDQLVLGNPIAVLAVSGETDPGPDADLIIPQHPGSPAASVMKPKKRKQPTDSLPVLVVSTALQCTSVGSTAQQQHVRLLTWVPSHQVTPVSSVTTDTQLAQDQGHGKWEVLQVLEGHAPMYCVLACGDGSSIMAAGKAGQAGIWNICCTVQHQVTPGGKVRRVAVEVCEYYRLPQAQYHGLSLQDITCLSGLPSQPHMVVGASGTGSVAVWDTMRRRCVLACHTSHASLTPPVPLDLLQALRTRQQLPHAKETARNGHLTQLQHPVVAGADGGEGEGGRGGQQGVIELQRGFRVGSDDSNLGQPLPGDVSLQLPGTFRTGGLPGHTTAHTPGPTPVPRRAGIWAASRSHFPTTGHTPGAALPRGSHPGGTRTEPRTFLPSVLGEGARKLHSRAGEGGNCELVGAGVGGGAGGVVRTPVCLPYNSQAAATDWMSTGLQGYSAGWTPYTVITSHARSALRKGVAIEWEHDILTPQNPLILMSVIPDQHQVTDTTATTVGRVNGRKEGDGLQQGGCAMQLAVFCGDKHTPAPGPHLPVDVQGIQCLGSRALLLTQHGQVQLWDMLQGGITWALQPRESHGQETPGNAQVSRGVAAQEVYRGCRGAQVVFLSCACACVAYEDVLLVCGWRD